MYSFERTYEKITQQSDKYILNYNNRLSKTCILTRDYSTFCHLKLIYTNNLFLFKVKIISKRR